MIWVCWLGLLQAGACPPPAPVGDGASLAQEWRGSPSTWAEQVLKQHAFGPTAPRGVVPLGPWDKPASHYGGEMVWSYGFHSWVSPNSPLPMTTRAIRWFDPAFQAVIHQAAAILGSDLPGAAQGRELGKLIQAGMTWDEVQALLGECKASQGFTVPHPVPTDVDSQLNCPDLCLSITFEYGAVAKVQTDLNELSFWSFPPFPVREYPVASPVFF